MRQTKEIRAVLHPPESGLARRLIEKKIGDFYATQVDKRLRSLTKAQKLAAVQALMDRFNT